MSTVPIYAPMRVQKYPEQLNLSDFEDKTLLILDDDPLEAGLQEPWKKKGFQKRLKRWLRDLNSKKHNSRVCLC